VIWSYYVPEFDGWKPGDDRTVFKVKAWFRNTSHFYTRPLVVDVNADGTNDLIYRTFGGNLLALNGNTGSKLWSVEEKESLSLGMAVIGQGKQKKIVALRNIYADTVRYEIAFFSLQGQKLASRPVSELSWGSGLNALSIDGDRVLINGRTKTFQVDPSGSVREIDRSIPFQFKSWNNELVNGYRNGNDPLFAEGFIPLKNGKKGVVVMNQCDLGNTDVGFVEIFSLEDGSVLDRFSLPACGEMPPVIRDVDLDGNLDLLFAGYDGYLYCYQLPKY
jgi:outer membrane protein assembly factor BamB